MFITGSGRKTHQNIDEMSSNDIAFGATLGYHNNDGRGNLIKQWIYM